MDKIKTNIKIVRFGSRFIKNITFKEIDWEWSTKWIYRWIDFLYEASDKQWKVSKTSSDEALHRETPTLKFLQVLNVGESHVRIRALVSMCVVDIMYLLALHEKRYL